MRRGVAAVCAAAVALAVLLPVSANADDREPVYAISDSVMIGMRSAMESRHGARFQFVWDGFVGIHGDRFLELLRENRAKVGRVAVVQIGHNDTTSAANFGAIIDGAMAILEGVDAVVWLTNQEFRVDQRAINQALFDAEARWPQLDVIDWRPLAHPPNVGGQAGIHLSPSGAAAMADLTAGALDAWRASLVPPAGAWAAAPLNARGGLHLAASADEVVTGAGPGGAPRVSRFGLDGASHGAFDAYDPGFRGGVRVAVCDTDGDATFEIVTGPGPGGGPQVRVFRLDGTPVSTFWAYDQAFAGGIWVACGPFGIVTGADRGAGPHVRVFRTDGTATGGFMAYNPAFTGGVRVAACDVDGDGTTEIVTGAGPGGGPHVRVFRTDGTATGGFMAYDPAFTGGVHLACGAASIVTGAGEPGGAHVRIVDANGNDRGAPFMAFTPGGSGVRVAVAGSHIVTTQGFRARPWVLVR